MTFWIIFAASIMMMSLLSFFLPDKINEKILLLGFIFIGIIAAFRNNIGADYYSYISIAQLASNFDISVEPSFLWIVSFCDKYNISYRFIFFVYSIFTTFFIYKGCKVYVKNRERVMTLLLYTFYPYAYWFYMGGIRQGLAISICFFCAQFVFTNKKKFISYIILASLIHYSAIFCLSFLFISARKKSISFIILFLSLSLIPVFSGVTLGEFLNDILVYVMNIIPGIDSHFLYYTNSTWKGISAGIIIENILFFMVYILYYRIYAQKQEDKEFYKISYFINIYFMGMLIRNTFSSIDAISRIGFYFVIFFIIVVPNIMHKIDVSFRIILASFICIFFLTYFLYGVFMAQYNFKASNVNINYEFDPDVINGKIP